MRWQVQLFFYFHCVSLSFSNLMNVSSESNRILLASWQTDLENPAVVSQIQSNLELAMATRRNHSVVFVHIPKNAGTTVKVFFHNSIRDLYGCVNIRLFEENTPRYEEEMTSLASANCRYTMLVNSEQKRRWLNMERNNRLHVRFLSGHIPVGACNLMSRQRSSSALNALLSPCFYTALAREPLDRFASHYNWVKYRGESNMRIFLQSRYPTLETYIRGIQEGQVWFYGIDNHQTRMLAGDLFFCEYLQICCSENRVCGSIPRFQVMREDIEKAKRNLIESMPVVGTVTRIVEYQAMMYLVYGYSAFTIDRSNAKQVENQQGSILSIEASQLLQQMQAADIEIYNYMNSLMNLQKRIIGARRVDCVTQYISHFADSGRNMDDTDSKASLMLDIQRC